MTAVRRALALCAGGLFASLGLGCGMSSPFADRSASRLPPAPIDQRPPAWLTAGAMPLPTSPALPSLPEPDLFSAQNEPHLGVPRVEEERSTTNHTIAEPLPAVTPVSAVSPIGPVGPISPIGPVGATSPTLPSVEPNWKPAGGFRAQ